MSTPPGDAPGEPQPPSDPAWLWEPRTFGDPVPSPGEAAAGSQPPIERAPEPSALEPVPATEQPPAPLESAAEAAEAFPETRPQEPAAGLAWDTLPVEHAAVATPPPPFDVPLKPVERYPTRFDIDYPEGMSRWKTFLRLFLMAPLAVTGSVIGLLLAIGLGVGYMTVFWRKKYPEWLFRGMAGAMGYTARIYAYAFLLTDKFPSFSPEDNPVHLDFDLPPSGELSRWRVVFWKAMLLWPMQIVLQFMGLALAVVTALAWFGILFTGNYPRGLFQFSVGVQRWYWRMTSYQASFNDRYPPYAISDAAGPGSNASVVINGVIGGLLVFGYGALIAAVIAVSGKHVTQTANYDQLKAGRGQVTTAFTPSLDEYHTVQVRLTRVSDPGDSLIQIIRPAAGERILVFQWTVSNGSSTSQLVAGDVARLKYEYDDDGGTLTKSIDAAFVGVNNVSAPAKVASGSTAVVQAVFVIPDDAEPVELWFHHGFANGGVKYEFR